MEANEIAMGFLAQPKEELTSPPLSPPSPRNHDDDDGTEPDDSEGEEEDGGAGAGGDVVGGGPPLKKGPWTPEEDRRLRTYVEAHGEGNWNQVQRNAGLNRCGKSCRLRWANHLRPHLKKGPFSKEEEQTIIELHAMHGNKWAQMAAKLPGRTDNEIKNFWNTRKKRRTKSGLGLYPDGLLSRMKNQDMDSHSPDDSRGNKRPNELSQGTSLEFENVIFEKLDYKKRSENFLAPIFTIPNSQPLNGMNPSKRHASSDMVSGYGGSPTCEQFPHEPERSSYTDINSGIKVHGVPFNTAIANGVPVFGSNFSTSGTIQRPMKMELPSVQCTSFESINSWQCHMPPATPLDLADNVIFSPACLPSQNNGMLDAVYQQGHVPEDPTKFQGGYEVLFSPASYVHPLNPHSSMFDGNLFEGSALDEFRTSKSPPSNLFEDSTQQADDMFAGKHFSPLPDLCRPSEEEAFFCDDSPHSECQPMNDRISVLLYGRPCDEVRLPAPGDGQEHRLESVSWNSMPGARHMPGS